MCPLPRGCVSASSWLCVRFLVVVCPLPLGCVSASSWLCVRFLVVVCPLPRGCRRATSSRLFVRLQKTPSSLMAMTTLGVCMSAQLSARTLNSSDLLSLCRRKPRPFAGNLPFLVTFRLSPVLDLISFLPSDLRPGRHSKN